MLTCFFACSTFQGRWQNPAPGLTARKSKRHDTRLRVFLCSSSMVGAAGHPCGGRIVWTGTVNPVAHTAKKRMTGMQNNNIEVLISKIQASLNGARCISSLIANSDDDQVSPTANATATFLDALERYVIELQEAYEFESISKSRSKTLVCS